MRGACLLTTCQCGRAAASPSRGMSRRGPVPWQPPPPHPHFSDAAQVENLAFGGGLMEVNQWELYVPAIHLGACALQRNQGCGPIASLSVPAPVGGAHVDGIASGRRTALDVAPAREVHLRPALPALPATQVA